MIYLNNISLKKKSSGGKAEKHIIWVEDENPGGGGHNATFIPLHFAL